jgi:hypothetical protein
MVKEENEMKKISKAWDEGRYASHIGQPSTVNPYNPDTDPFDYKEWLRGWDAGHFMKQDLIQYGSE